MKLELILYTPTQDTSAITFDLPVITNPVKNGGSPKGGTGDSDASLGYVSRFGITTNKIQKLKQRINEYNKGKSKNIVTCQLVNPKTNLLIRF